MDSASHTESPLTVDLGAAKMARLIASGQSSSEMLVRQHIDRLRHVQPQLNALVAERFDQAVQEARAADARQRRGEPLGPLHGVPFTVKECLDLTGTASTGGMPDRAGHRAPTDEPHVARLRQAGAIALGKTNVAQLLFYYESDNPLYGRSNNPWNAARTCGGSSGGEAALIAAGASPLGIGTDIGGSVRVPAAFCGVAGIKPTSGRCNDMGRLSVPLGQRAVPSQVGLLARHTEDLALGLSVINGAQTASGLPAMPLGDPALVDVSSLRIAWYTDDGSFTVAPGVARAVREAADLLRQKGAQVHPWTPPDALAGMNLLYGIFGADGLKLIKRLLGKNRRAPQISQLAALASLPRSLIELMRTLLKAAGQPSLADGLAPFGHRDTAHYWQLLEAQIDYQQSFAQAMRQAPGGPFDVILCPPCALPAFTHGASKDLLTAGAYACLYNLLGYPAGVVPMGHVREVEQVGRSPSRDLINQAALRVEEGSAGLPLSVQVVGRPWQEHHVLAVMAALEQANRELSALA